jgi:hypothetical protein
MKTRTKSLENLKINSLDTLVRRHRAAMKSYRLLRARANKRKEAAK